MGHDSATTIAGGGSGLALLATVRWEAFPAPYGEVVKISLALLLILAGYWMYRPPASPA